MFGLFGSSSKDNHSSNFDNDDFDPDGVLTAAINPKELLAEENGKVDLDFDKRGLVEEEPEEEIDTEDVEEKYEEVVYVSN